MSHDRRVRAVLCDLDDTLFDHSHATAHALGRLQAADASLASWPLQELVVRHDEVLEELHRRVLLGELTIDEARLERFSRLLGAAGGHAARTRAPEVARLYRGAYQQGWRPVPGAVDFVSALGRAGVPLLIVTNNGVEEQTRKLEFCRLLDRIHSLVTSEEVGEPKPGARIYQVALERVGVEADAAVMLGDSWPSDVLGARDAGIRPVWFNRTAEPAPDSSVAVLRSLDPADAALARLLD